MFPVFPPRRYVVINEWSIAARCCKKRISIPPFVFSACFPLLSPFCITRFPTFHLLLQPVYSNLAPAFLTRLILSTTSFAFGGSSTVTGEHSPSGLRGESPLPSLYNASWSNIGLPSLSPFGRLPSWPQPPWATDLCVGGHPPHGSYSLFFCLFRPSSPGFGLRVKPRCVPFCQLCHFARHFPSLICWPLRPLLSTQVFITAGEILLHPLFSPSLLLDVRFSLSNPNSSLSRGGIFLLLASPRFFPPAPRN